MGTKQPEEKVTKNTQKPKSIESRRQTVEKPAEKSFEERTQVQQPWLDQDGNQVNQ